MTPRQPRSPIWPGRTPASPSSKSRAAATGIASNATLIALKLTAGLLTGSVGLISDAVHSLMDLLASVIAFFSVRKADEPADVSHRYGHEKIEDLAAGAQALLLLLGAAFIALEATRRLINGGRLESIDLGIAAAGAAAVINLLVSSYLTRTGRSTGSVALMANAADLRTDAIVSTGVLVSLVLVTFTGASWLDPVVGILVAVVISRTGIKILTDAGRRLADEALPADELAVIDRIVSSFIGDQVVGVHDLRARHVGNHHQVDLHMQFADGTTLRQAHFLSHQLQEAIAVGLPGTTVLIHLEPEERVRPDRFTGAETTSAVASPTTAKPSEHDQPDDPNQPPHRQSRARQGPDSAT